MKRKCFSSRKNIYTITTYGKLGMVIIKSGL